MSLSNTLIFAGHISELEKMHEVTESKLVELARPTVIFSCIDKIELPELDDADTKPLENLQDNGATLPVLTQPSPSNSPLEDAPVAPADSPPHSCVEDGIAALQERYEDLPDVYLLSADYMMYGLYQDWVHQNQGEHLYGWIAEDSKWQAQWK